MEKCVIEWGIQLHKTRAEDQAQAAAHLISTAIPLRRSLSPEGENCIEMDVREVSAPQRKKTQMSILEKYGRPNSTIIDDIESAMTLEDKIKYEVKNEMDAYYATSIDENISDFDLLNWWHSNSNKFPHLHSYATFVHSIPATSAPSERSFSTAGHTMTDLRARLGPENLSALIFLQSNWDIVEKFNLFEN